MNQDKRIFALGFFDGVHLGHQALLRECRALANSLSCETAAITFDRHPKSLFLPGNPTLISTKEERKKLLMHYGIDHVSSFPVTEEFMGKSWRSFLDELMEQGAAGFVCGDDFHFGFRGEGTAEKLQEYCREKDIPCVIVAQQELDGIRISSTHIRKLIESGKMESATRFLGHPYFLTGTVVHGHQLGRKLGIPTANLLLPEGLAVPKFGVYACRALIDGTKYLAVTNIGTRPTVSGQGITVEPWILDFEGDLYGRKITLEFHYFLRAEMKFPDLTAMQSEIYRNAEQTRVYFQEQEAAHGES